MSLAYFDLGEHALALEFAQRAVKLAPIDALMLDTEAQVLGALGHFEETLDVERAAVAFLPDGASAPEVLQRLKEYEAHAATRSAGP